MTGQTLNGTRRPPLAWDSFTPIRFGVMGEPETGPEAVAPAPPAEPAVDLVAAAEAAAIRARAEAETEAIRIAAQAEADAVLAKAEAEAEKLRIANERAAMALAEKRAEHENKIAEAERRREETERLRRNAQVSDETARENEAAQAAQVEKSESLWMKAALGFAIACAVVALPVQMAAFWNEDAPWLLAAPVMLEGGAWIVLSGAAAAVAGRRPHWHYRTIAWLLAGVAAGINLYHGIHAFDPATAGATAFASLAGPGVWDLHEHGRIRKRDGVLTRREQKARKRAEKAAAKERAAREAATRAEQKAAQVAAQAAADELAANRARDYETEWEHAKKLAWALGETVVTEAVWRRAWHDVHGTDPGDTVDTIRTRRTAERRIEMARGEAVANTPSKVTSAQRAIQVKAPRTRSSYKPVPPRRTKGDTAPFHPVARALAADAKRRANTVSAEISGPRKDV